MTLRIPQVHSNPPSHLTDPVAVNIIIPPHYTDSFNVNYLLFNTVHTHPKSLVHPHMQHPIQQADCFQYQFLRPDVH